MGYPFSRPRENDHAHPTRPNARARACARRSHQKPAQKARAAARLDLLKVKKVQDAALILHVYRGYTAARWRRRRGIAANTGNTPSRLRRLPEGGIAACMAPVDSYRPPASKRSQTRSAVSGSFPTQPAPSPFQAAAACRLACARSGRMSGRATGAPFPLRHITPPVVTPQLLHWIMTTFSMACAITSTTGLPPQKGQTLKAISHISSPPS